MAKPNTKQVRIGKYKVSPHAQNRVAEPGRNLKKSDMTSNLLLKPDYQSKVDEKHGAYTKVRKKIVTHIMPKTNIVKSIRRTSNTENEIKRLKKRGL